MAKSVFDELYETILDNELPKINNIMAYMASEIQRDFVNETYRLLDIYYENYTPRVYIRTDELRSRVSKNGRFRGKGGRFVAPSNTVKTRLANDISLHDAMHAGSFGVARPNENGDGYIGGVIFDPDDIDYNIDMKHSIAGIEEFDMVRNFLLSDDENQKGNKAAKYRNFPSANSQLQKYLESYYNGKMDKLYDDACRKFR
jgi:hypothetical protein